MTLVSDQAITSSVIVEERKMEASTKASYTSLRSSDKYRWSFQYDQGIYASNRSIDSETATTLTPVFKADARSKTHIGQHSNAVVTLLNSWVEKVENLSATDQTFNVKEFVRATESYLLALGNVKEASRLLAFSLNIVRFNGEFDHAAAQHMSALLKKVDTLNLSNQSIMSFVRQMRAKGYNASSLSLSE